MGSIYVKYGTKSLDNHSVSRPHVFALLDGMVIVRCPPPCEKEVLLPYESNTVAIRGTSGEHATGRNEIRERRERM